jgi:hypothetical protein
VPIARTLGHLRWCGDRDIGAMRRGLGDPVSESQEAVLLKAVKHVSEFKSAGGGKYCLKPEMYQEENARSTLWS